MFVYFQEIIVTSKTNDPNTWKMKALRTENCTQINQI